jgi:channel protein (hemolysin III family)
MLGGGTAVLFLFARVLANVEYQSVDSQFGNETLSGNTLPFPVAISLIMYGVCLFGMLCCSTLFNSLAWSLRHLWVLQLIDHAGILLLICGTYTPIMILAGGCEVPLAFVWTLSLVSFLAKASGSKLDHIALHVPIFLLTGWTCITGVRF